MVDLVFLAVQGPGAEEVVDGFVVLGWVLALERFQEQEAGRKAADEGEEKGKVGS